MGYYDRPQPQIGAQAQLDRDLAAIEAAREHRAARDAQRRTEFDEQVAARAKQVAAWNEADRKEREARAAQREVDRVERTEAAAEQLKSRMRAAFLEQPGSTPSGFEAAWPEILKRHQIEQTVATAALGDPVQRLAAEMKAMRGPAILFEKAAVPVAVED